MSKTKERTLLPFFLNSISSRIIIIVLSIFFIAAVSFAYYLYNMQRDYIRLAYGNLTDTITRLVFSVIVTGRIKDIGELNGFLADVGRTNPSLTALVFDSDLKVIASTDRAYLGLTAEELKEKIEDEIYDEVSQVLIKFSKIKKTYFKRGEFETIVPFSSRSIGKGVIYTLINFNYLRKALISALVKQIFTLSLVFGLCTAAIYLLIRRLVLNPMAVFLRGVDDVAKGIYRDLKINVDIKEFKSMAEAFNNMLSALKSREEVIRAQNEQLSTLYWVNETFLTENSLKRALEKILLLMTAVGGIKKKGIIFLSRQGQLEPVATIGFDINKLKDKCKERIFQCLCSRSYNDKITIFIDSDSEEHLPCLEQRHHYHLIFPIMTARKSYGVVCLYFTEKPSEELKILLNHIGEEVAVAIERYNLIDELNETSKKLASLNEEMRALLNAVSHDLRNPLVSIEGYAEMLSEDVEDKLLEEQKEYLIGIHRNVAYISDIANALLQLSRIERREVTQELIDIKEFFDELCLDILARGNDVEIKILGRTLKIQSDRTLLWHIFSNLINNSIKYAKPDESAIIEIDWLRKDCSIMFTVKDNGIGIDREFIKSVFLPFSRATTVKEGAGLGLSIVKKSVELLGGRVWIDSIKGEGTIVYVELPL